MNVDLVNDEKRPQHPLVGTVVEPYAIIDVIAAGGMGVVFKARHMLTDRIVALKLLPSELARDESNVQRVKLEAKALAQLKHPNIITTFDFGFTYMQEPFIVMEFVPGESLKEVLDREVLLPVDRALRIFLQVVDGMRYAHGAKILHRDLKPHNIMVSDEPEPDHVKVLDFGVAKFAEYTQKITRTGEVVGSPLYMSPEQCTGKPTDHRCDIYSIGVMMFETLTGNPPFRGENYISTVHLKCTKLAPNFKDVVPGRVFPERLEMIVLKCLEIEPEKRYATMAELKADLELVAGVVPKVDRPKTSQNLQLNSNTRTSANNLPAQPGTQTGSGPGPGEIGWQPSWAGGPAAVSNAVPNKPNDWSDSIVSGISDSGSSWRGPSSPNLSDDNWANTDVNRHSPRAEWASPGPPDENEWELTEKSGVIQAHNTPNNGPGSQDLASLSTAIEASATGVGNPMARTNQSNQIAPQGPTSDEVTGDRPEVDDSEFARGPAPVPTRDPQADSHFVLTWDTKTGPAWSATSAAPQKPKGPPSMSGTRNRIQGMPSAGPGQTEQNVQLQQMSTQNAPVQNQPSTPPQTVSQANDLVNPTQPRSAAVKSSQGNKQIPQATQGGPSTSPPPPSSSPPNPWGGGGFANLAETGWGPPPTKEITNPANQVVSQSSLPQASAPDQQTAPPPAAQQPQHQTQQQAQQPPQPAPHPGFPPPREKPPEQPPQAQQAPLVVPTGATGMPPQNVQMPQGQPGPGMPPMGQPGFNGQNPFAPLQGPPQGSPPGGIPMPGAPMPGQAPPRPTSPGTVPVLPPSNIGVPQGPNGLFPSPPPGVQVHTAPPQGGPPTSMPMPQGFTPMPQSGPPVPAEPAAQAKPPVVPDPWADSIPPGKIPVEPTSGPSPFDSQTAAPFKPAPTPFDSQTATPFQPSNPTPFDSQSSAPFQPPSPSPLSSPVAQLAQSLMDDQSSKTSTSTDDRPPMVPPHMQTPAQAPNWNSAADEKTVPAPAPMKPAPTKPPQGAPTQPGWNADSDDRFAMEGESPIKQFAERMRGAMPDQGSTQGSGSAEFKSYEPVSLAELNAIKTPNVAKSTKPTESGLSKVLSEQQSTTTGSSPVYASTSKPKPRFFDEDEGASRPTTANSMRFSSSRGDTDGRKMVLMSLVGVAILAVIATACFMVYQHNSSAETVSSKPAPDSTGPSSETQTPSAASTEKTTTSTSTDTTASTADGTTTKPAPKPRQAPKTETARVKDPKKPKAAVVAKVKKPKKTKAAVAKAPADSPDVPSVPKRRKAYSTWSSYYGNE